MQTDFKSLPVVKFLLTVTSKTSFIKTLINYPFRYRKTQLAKLSI